jgi:hypothetical protein
MEYPEVNQQNIWNFRQNNPELIIADARLYLGLNKEQCDLLRTILLARGVNKWLKARRDLIAYKKMVKHQICEVQKQRSESREAFHKLKPILKLLMEVRRQLKDICKTDRWQVWPRLGSHHQELRAMNSLRASG